MLTSNPLRLKAKFWPEADALRLGTYIRDRALFDGAHEVQIEHRGALYRLRLTSLGKLILTK